jgi:hypothetical protein
LIRPKARHGTPFGPRIVFAHSHDVTNAGVNQPWGRPTAYAFNFTVPEPTGAERRVNRLAEPEAAPLSPLSPQSRGEGRKWGR